MLEFHSLTVDNFDRFAKDILSSEEVFPESIRETREGYVAALQQPGAQAFVAQIGGVYVGNVVGFAPGLEQQQLLRLNELDIRLQGLMYLFNITAMLSCQGRGVGKRLLDYFLQASRAAGYERVGGHFRGNGSLKNFLHRGGEVLAVFDDWFGTGEAYSYSELALCRIKQEDNPQATTALPLGVGTN